MDNIPHISEVAEKIKKSGRHIAFAESCTGGYLAKTLTDLPGASEIIECSVVSYSNRIKEEKLGVPKEIIDRFTEVSAECAEAMAEGICRFAGSEIGVSTTGYAGPTGENVGLVYVCVKTPDGKVCEELHLSGDRDAVRKGAVCRVFELLDGIIK